MLASGTTKIHSLLIVDDSTVQRRHAAELCRELGIQSIHEARDGREALELLSALAVSPGLLIVDLEMPRMDGIELLQQLQRGRVNVPIIVASGRDSALIEAVETMSQTLGLEVLAGLRKPLQRDQLERALLTYRRSDGPRQRAEPRPHVAIEKMELAHAIAHDALGVHYQPKVDILTGIVRGVEALARWHHPRLGFVPPDAFISLAEREHLIHDLTRSILGQALAQAADWMHHGLRLSVAVNISARVLDAPGLVEEISALADRHEVPTQQVVLEITEGSVVSHLDVALGVLARLRLKGFRISIDDYGTGFSSMQQLARIPFTELKIDRSFVHGAHQRRSMRVILRSALEMARQLELVTVAEGIETLEDWRLLQQFGCMVGQGYLIARPMPAEALPQWMKTHLGRLDELRCKSPVLERKR